MKSCGGRTIGTGLGKESRDDVSRLLEQGRVDSCCAKDTLQSKGRSNDMTIPVLIVLISPAHKGKFCAPFQRKKFIFAGCKFTFG
jgi:hypothetical protein